MSKRLGIFLVVALLTLSEGPAQIAPMRTLLPVFDGETILRRDGGPPVRLPHNSSDTVAKEVQEPEVRKLLLRTAKLPEDTALRYMIDTQYEVQVSTFGLTSKGAESFAVHCATMSS